MKMAANNIEEGDKIIIKKTSLQTRIIISIIILLTICITLFLIHNTTTLSRTYTHSHPAADAKVQVQQQQQESASDTSELNAGNNKTNTSVANSSDSMRLVCYFSYYSPNKTNAWNAVNLSQIDPELCTHINVGDATVVNSSIVLDEDLQKVLLEELPRLRLKNPTLKVLLWVGGGGVAVKDFAIMVKTHESRKVFIKSMKSILRNFSLDGLDLDWEFPSAYDKERMHFSQLLHEIKEEFRREKRDYLLTVAVAAVEGIAEFAYDIREINLYADYVNLMSYDYHFYTPGTPFTGLNAPLYAKENEKLFLGTLNINYSISWWISNGLQASKLVVGLPTFGHSFTLINPFNSKIGAPSSGYGACGVQGFTSYSDVCQFSKMNLASVTYDNETHSPYLVSGPEWISFENVESITAKAKFIKSQGLGGIMVFSLNTDDVKNACEAKLNNNNNGTTSSLRFPLTETIKSILYT